jgi:glyoxylate reductase
VPSVKVHATRRLPGDAWNELGAIEIGPIEGDADVLIVAGDAVDDAVLDRMPSLQLVANYGVGYDNVDVEACRARGVAVTNTPGVLDDATADLAIALVLAVRRRVVEGDRLVREGRWGGGWSEHPFFGRDLRGSTLGIVGLGRIGGAVRKRALAFGMHVVYARRIQITADTGFRSLDDLLRESDVVSIHAPLNADTRGLISRERLASMPDGATLVNTARGPIVDEDALVDELTTGRLSAGLDVFVHEPHVPEALRGLANVVLTPHIGSATVETRAAMTRVLVDNVLAFQRGEPLLTPV